MKAEGRCWRQCGELVADHFHIFWGCPAIQPYWSEIVEVITQGAGKKAVTRKWLMKELPVQTEWEEKVQEIYKMENSLFLSVEWISSVNTGGNGKAILQLMCGIRYFDRKPEVDMYLLVVKPFYCQ